MRFVNVRLAVAIVGCLLNASPALPAVRLPRLFSDNMVVQRDVKIPLWGWAIPGERVVVSLAGQQAQGVTDSNGRWNVRLGPLAAGGPWDMEIEGSNRLRVRNVWVGDVWVCSGQSNMQMTMSRLTDPLPESFPKIRMFTVQHHVASQPQSDIEGEWTAAESPTVGGFSAVGYYFGRELYERLKIPMVQECRGRPRHPKRRSTNGICHSGRGPQISVGGREDPR